MRVLREPFIRSSGEPVAESNVDRHDRLPVELERTSPAMMLARLKRMKSTAATASISSRRPLTNPPAFGPPKYLALKQTRSAPVATSSCIFSGGSIR